MKSKKLILEGKLLRKCEYHDPYDKDGVYPFTSFVVDSKKGEWTKGPFESIFDGVIDSNVIDHKVKVYRKEIKPGWPKISIYDCESKILYE